MQIARTTEWEVVIQKLEERHSQLLESVLHAARHDLDKVQQATGQYDGFRMAIEYLQAIGRNEDA